MLPSDFFRRNVVLSFQEDAIGIRLRDVIGPDNMMWDNMMWGSDYPHSESTFPQSRKILAAILAGVPDDEQAKPAPDPDPGIAGGNTARVYNFDVASVREMKPGASDKDVLDEADSGDRVLVTEDRDFGELVVRQRLKVRGIILLELDRLPSAAEAELVAEIVRIHVSKLPANLLVVEPARVRVRPLPR